MKKIIYVIYTGGTIGMQYSVDGFIPKANFLAHHLASISELNHPDMPNFVLNEYDPLVDSACMTPTHWQMIAQDIKDHYHQYDGFIVLHGTDTMAYTASALSFMLEGLQKPVIITGSQLPLSQLRSDGRRNFLNALYIAAHYPIAEVCLFFNHQLFRGNRSTKVHANSFDAFTSPNFPLLLKAGIKIELKAGVITPSNQVCDQKLHGHVITPQPIAVISWYPGIDACVIDRLLNPPLKAIILRTYGLGNASGDAQVIARLQQAHDQGMILVNTSQCLHAYVDMEGYATGHSLAKGGVISARDMTLEATLTKLHYLLSQSLSADEVRLRMRENLRGELTLDASA